MAIENSIITYFKSLWGRFDGTVDSGGDTVDIGESVKRGYRRLYQWHKHAADTLAADATDPEYFIYAHTKCRVVGAWLIPSDSLTADATDFATIEIETHPGATLATMTTELVAAGGTGDWAEGVELPFELSGTTTLELDAGQTAKVFISKDGAGVVVPPCCVIVITEEI